MFNSRNSNSKTGPVRTWFELVSRGDKDHIRGMRRSIDPIPHIRFTKYVRFRWGSPELEEWTERRIVSSSNRIVGRALGKESK